MKGLNWVLPLLLVPLAAACNIYVGNGEEARVSFKNETAFTLDIKLHKTSNSQQTQLAPLFPGDTSPKYSVAEGEYLIYWRENRAAAAGGGFNLLGKRQYYRGEDKTEKVTQNVKLD